MTEPNAAVAIGTAATLLATILLLLRANFQGRRPVLAFTRHWVAMDNRMSGCVLVLLSAIAVTSFASISSIESSEFSEASDLSVFSKAPTALSLDFSLEESQSTSQAWGSLRAYAEEIESKQQLNADVSSTPASVELPDVDTMIAKLLARLEKQPNDVNGWKMLAWSYLSTDRAEEATTAYETALKLEPGDTEIKKGMEAAKAAHTLTTQTPLPNATLPATSPIAEHITDADAQSAAQAQSMIRSMVDQLATRLETTPNDEDGWLRLMRARMTLGEKDAAKAALRKALETFASNGAAKARLASTARELGVESN